MRSRSAAVIVSTLKDEIHTVPITPSAHSDKDSTIVMELKKYVSTVRGFYFGLIMRHDIRIVASVDLKRTFDGM